MNYVSVLMVAVALFAVGYWYAAGRYYYIGPRTKAQLILGVDDDGKGAPGLAEMSEGSSEEKRINEISGHDRPLGEMPGEGLKGELQ